MLFTVKKNFLLSVVIALIFAGAALAAKYTLGLEWQSPVAVDFIPGFASGFAAILASDIVLVLLLTVIFRNEFIKTYMQMAEYFTGQRASEILAGGLLAAGEEMLFRGVVLQGMVQVLGAGPVSAVLVSSVLFGLFHVIARRRLALFSIWAVWEGAVLGAVYLYTGSLLVAAAVHAAHDVFGFALFALNRKYGFFLTGGPARG
jgi:membrane protease YdiL (CAAX protease family)